MPVAQRFEAAGGGALSVDMQRAYERDGFLILDNFFTASACDSLRARALELIDDTDIASLGSVFSTSSHAHTKDDYFQSSGDKIRYFLEEEALDDNGALRRQPSECVNKIGHALHDLDPVFEQFSRSPALARLAGEIGYQQPLLLQSMYIFKSPGIGGEVDCHQDSTFLYTTPLSCTGFWVALEDATVENGCMYALPGEHKGGLKQRFYRKPDTGELTFETLSEHDWHSQAVALPAPKGTLVVLNGELPHQSSANRSDKSRHAYTLHVIDGVCQYPADNWLRRDAKMPLRGFQ